MLYVLNWILEYDSIFVSVFKIYFDLIGFHLRQFHSFIIFFFMILLNIIKQYHDRIKLYSLYRIHNLKIE